MNNNSQFDSQHDAKNSAKSADGAAAQGEEFIVDSVLAVANKELERQQIQSEVEAFLAAGGQIHLVADDLLADPPKRPQSAYGSQPI